MLALPLALGGSAPAGQMSCWFVVQSLGPALVCSLMVGDAPGGLLFHGGCHLTCVRPLFCLRRAAFPLGRKLFGMENGVSVCYVT